MPGAAADAEAESGREGFTCSALLMCLYLPGLSKKKPEEAITTSPPTADPPPPSAPDQQKEAWSRAASLEKSECASLCSRKNIVFDFVVEEGDQAPPVQAAIPIHGYCPSPCFDLPVELIRAGERFGVAAADDGVATTTPVTATFVFDDGQRGGALKKMASCLGPGVDASSEPRSPHLARFLSVQRVAAACRDSVV